MADLQAVPENVERLEEEGARIDTQCYLCQQELPDGMPVIASKCGVLFHEDCAKRSVTCPACGENLLEHFLSHEAKKKIVKKDRLYTMLLFLVPFVVVEVLIAFWSMWNHPSKWGIPPWFGEAFILDLVILIAGIIIAVLIYSKFGYKPEKKTINVLVIRQRGPTPEKPDEQLYACGYGERLSPTLMGDVSIPNKKGVQRENVVRIAVDRLTKTSDDNYVWLNPTFLKILNPKDNPQPSTPEEMDKAWMATGKTTLEGESGEVGEAGEGGEGDEEKLCKTCEKPLEFISEYNAWYCSSCEKYDEEEEGESGDLPPPEEGSTPPQ